MIEINLLPNVKRELLKTRVMRNRVISISFLVGRCFDCGSSCFGVDFGQPNCSRGGPERSY